MTSGSLRTERAKGSALSALAFAGVVGLVLWAPLPFGSVEPWAVGVLRVGACLLVALWAVAGAASGRFVVPVDPIVAVLYAAAILAFAQWATGSSKDPFASFQAGVTLTAFATVFALSLSVLDRPTRLHHAAVTLFWYGFVVSIVGVLVYLSGTRKLFWIRDSPAETFFGPYVNKNHFAGFVELLLPLGLGPLAVGAVARDRRPLVIFGAVVMGTALVLSRSRAGLFCAGAELFVLVSVALALGGSRVSDQHKAGRSVAILVIVACVAFGVLWLGAEPVSQAFGSLPGDIASTDTMSRQQIWSSTAALGMANPITGAGLGAYGVAITTFWFASERAMLLFAHNDYLQVFSDAGAIGVVLAILYVVLLGRAFARGLRRIDLGLRGVALGAGVACFGLLLHSFVDFNLQIPANALLFLFVSALVSRAAVVPEVFGEVVR